MLKAVLKSILESQQDWLLPEEMEFPYYLTDAYRLFLVPMYDTSLKVQARNPRKVYSVDQGLENFSSVSGSPDMVRLLENMVYLHLRRLGYEIWYFKGKKECDFICRYNKETFSAIQVFWEVGLQNEKREVEGLFEAMLRLGLTEGTIITFNQEDNIVKVGKTIRLVPGWKWFFIKTYPKVSATGEMCLNNQLVCPLVNKHKILSLSLFFPF